MTHSCRVKSARRKPRSGFPRTSTGSAPTCTLDIDSPRWRPPAGRSSQLFPPRRSRRPRPQRNQRRKPQSRPSRRVAWRSRTNLSVWISNIRSTRTVRRWESLQSAWSSRRRAARSPSGMAPDSRIFRRIICGSNATAAAASARSSLHPQPGIQGRGFHHVGGHLSERKRDNAPLCNRGEIASSRLGAVARINPMQRERPAGARSKGGGARPR